MNLRGLIGRLSVGAAGRSVPEGGTSGEPAHEVTACLLWGKPGNRGYADRHFGRVLYSTDPGRAHDLEFLGRLGCRLSELWWRRGRMRGPTENWLRDELLHPWQRDRRVAVPPAYCGQESVYLHDVSWRPEELGAELVAGDPNRSLCTLSIAPGPALPRPAAPGEATRRARQRLRALRARGAVPVTAVRVQANYRLYEPGEEDRAGAVLFALSPDADVGWLIALADELYEARDSDAEVARDLEDAVAMLRANVHHWMFHRRRRLSPGRTGGHEAYVADLWFHRPFLRDGRIVREHGRTLRCLAEPGDVGGLELLPWDAEVGPSVRVPPGWLTWENGQVARLARAIADEHAFDRLPVLADALEEAGCTDQHILSHCRQPGTHARSCWVVDSLLGEG